MILWYTPYRGFQIFKIMNNSGIEDGINNYSGRNVGTDGYSNFTL